MRPPHDKEKTMKSTNTKLVFCTMVYPVEFSEINVLLLAESLREFGGDLGRSPLWVFIPEYGKSLSPETHERLCELNVNLIHFDIELDTLRFFFAGEVTAVALAEESAREEVDLLAWLDNNTLVLNEPVDFYLPPEVVLGYRPVHHLLLGSRYGEPPDAFWTAIYKACQVPEERIFPMKPHVEDLQMRPYFNAGILVTRPEQGLFQAWRDTLFQHNQEPEFMAFYDQDERYQIFMHQAILSGVILRELAPEQTLELPATYNYPLHLFNEDQTGDRPASLEDLVTFRHEGFHRDPDWPKKIPAGEELKSWLIDKVFKI
jgi:hypothetical protein